jgi:AcrR family transcriptional regulator
VRRAILHAAFELFVERGLAGPSIEEIAKRAAVARTSIYRRWSSRDVLLAEAIEAARNKFAPEHSADLIGPPRVSSFTCSLGSAWPPKTDMG